MTVINGYTYVSWILERLISRVICYVCQVGRYAVLTPSPLCLLTNTEKAFYSETELLKF